MSTWSFDDLGRSSPAEHLDFEAIFDDGIEEDGEINQEWFPFPFNNDNTNSPPARPASPPLPTLPTAAAAPPPSPPPLQTIATLPPNTADDTTTTTTTNNNNNASRPRFAHNLLNSDSDTEVTFVRSRQPPSAVTTEDNELEFVTVEDSDDDDHLDTMPPPRRRAPARSANTASAVIDLDSTPPATGRRATGTRKRSADESASASGPAAKRSRRASQEDVVEELDLTEEAPSAEEELLKTQQQEAIKAQQAEEESGPQKIGKKSCIICMENYTNCTVTACGHLYCHECLTRALMAAAKNSDRNTGPCPMCRKPLSHTSKKKYDIIPISFMTKKEFDKRQNRRRGLDTLG